jgi:hypothetical protein
MSRYEVEFTHEVEEMGGVMLEVTAIIDCDEVEELTARLADETGQSPEIYPDEIYLLQIERKLVWGPGRKIYYSSTGLEKEAPESAWPSNMLPPRGYGVPLRSELDLDRNEYVRHLVCLGDVLNEIALEQEEPTEEPDHRGIED